MGGRVLCGGQVRVDVNEEYKCFCFVKMQNKNWVGWGGVGL